jgi:hypothetical protein
MTEAKKPGRGCARAGAGRQPKNVGRPDPGCRPSGRPAAARRFEGGRAPSHQIRCRRHWQCCGRPRQHVDFRAEHRARALGVGFFRRFAHNVSYRAEFDAHQGATRAELSNAAIPCGPLHAGRSSKRSNDTYRVRRHPPSRRILLARCARCQHRRFMGTGFRSAELASSKCHATRTKRGIDIPAEEISGAPRYPLGLRALLSSLARGSGLPRRRDECLGYL